MPGQGENTMDDHAFDYLGSYYAKRKKNSGLLINRLEQTRKGAWVDGLFAYRSEDNTFFAASLSTRQSGKLAALLSHYKRKGLGHSRFVTSVLLLAATAGIGYYLNLWLILWVMPLFVAVAGFVVHSALEKRRLQRQMLKSVDELKDFPADEQWLCIEVSSLSWRHNSLAEKLSALCERRGIGLITIGKRARITLHQEPRAVKCRRDDFLSYYVAEAAIRKTLTDQFMRVA
ncbi:hypothetical protein H9Q13_06990 [Pontibacter sp. JH31]|uniref:YcxB-like protein n=1 Tax=Pontibacter aquaedesilientis TaxID=2766980 RepID=A0ABR7XF29_9BACT|nr:hypothetical protein [Pontibacter aquaedesilientis]MBD1396905.1 hypothetical protein [Pontibacter aquaedesilientis]